MASTSTIAQGCFGKVYKEKYNDTWAAIKRVPHHLISKHDLDRESQVYNKAKHPNIVKLLGDITLKDCKWVIPLEFIFGEDLETTIFKASSSKIQLTPSNRGKIITGMCEGLLHLHLRDIVHQDLKPENIMVEHGTHRAVIIDLGLAKFFRRGLNSAMDMGNEAYSAPEVLRIGSQRDQRSDVWAMGKIIAELCARIRLHTPSVCPDKIKETLRDQAYCNAVCRMVETNPSLRATMAGVIGAIRRATDVKTVPTAPVQIDRLQPPSTQGNIPNRSPSPMNGGARDPSPLKISPSPFNRDLPPHNRDPAARRMDRLHVNRAPLFNRDLSPNNKGPPPHKRGVSPFNRDPLPQADVAALPPHQVTEVKKKPEAMASADFSQDSLKKKLLQDDPDLARSLPITGKVVSKRFVEKDGRWEQTEIVTKDGKIVKYITINSN
ncbi:uncharacterized protein LOC142999099 [Genypterus blacodes]|uniref:uncharacterized protein LOC142999099 n=1 Tax=Genypterus blacodes TaxID=154954 RepID=UPI003F75A859